MQTRRQEVAQLQEALQRKMQKLEVDAACLIQKAFRAHRIRQEAKLRLRGREETYMGEPVIWVETALVWALKPHSFVPTEPRPPPDLRPEPLSPPDLRPEPLTPPDLRPEPETPLDLRPEPKVGVEPCAPETGWTDWLPWNWNVKEEKYQEDHRAWQKSKEDHADWDNDKDEHDQKAQEHKHWETEKIEHDQKAQEHEHWEGEKIEHDKEVNKYEENHKTWEQEQQDHQTAQSDFEHKHAEWESAQEQADKEQHEFQDQLDVFKHDLAVVGLTSGITATCVRAIDLYGSYKSGTMSGKDYAIQLTKAFGTSTGLSVFFASMHHISPHLSLAVGFSFFLVQICPMALEWFQGKLETWVFIEGLLGKTANFFFGCEFGLLGQSLGSAAAASVIGGSVAPLVGASLGCILLTLILHYFIRYPIDEMLRRRRQQSTLHQSYDLMGLKPGSSMKEARQRYRDLVIERMLVPVIGSAKECGCFCRIAQQFGFCKSDLQKIHDALDDDLVMKKTVYLEFQTIPQHCTLLRIDEANSISKSMLLEVEGFADLTFAGRFNHPDKVPHRAQKQQHENFKELCLHYEIVCKAIKRHDDSCQEMNMSASHSDEQQQPLLASIDAPDLSQNRLTTFTRNDHEEAEANNLDQRSIRTPSPDRFWTLPVAHPSATQVHFDTAPSSFVSTAGQAMGFGWPRAHPAATQVHFNTVPSSSMSTAGQAMGFEGPIALPSPTQEQFGPVPSSSINVASQAMSFEACQTLSEVRGEEGQEPHECEWHLEGEHTSSNSNRYEGGKAKTHRRGARGSKGGKHKQKHKKK